MTQPFEKYFDTEQTVYEIEQSERDVYIVIDFIGKGSYGGVYKAISCKTKQLVAIKYLFSATFEKFAQELDLLKQVFSICRDYTVCVLDSYEHSGKYRIVTEFIKGGTELTDYMFKLPLKTENGLIGRLERDDLAVHLVRALYTMHGVGITHQDLKPENIMWDFTTQTPKLTDFGGACSLVSDCGETLTQECGGRCGFIGTKQYAPPEYKDNIERIKKLKSSKESIKPTITKLMEQKAKLAKLEIEFDKMLKAPDTGKLEDRQRELVQEIAETRDHIDILTKSAVFAQKIIAEEGPHFSKLVKPPSTFQETMVHDIWSIGLVLLEWYTAENPNNRAPIVYDMYGASDLQLQSVISTIENYFARKLLTLLLEPDKAKRFKNIKLAVKLLDKANVVDFVTTEYRILFKKQIRTKRLDAEEEALVKCFLRDIPKGGPMFEVEGRMPNARDDIEAIVLNKLELDKWTKKQLVSFAEKMGIDGAKTMSPQDLTWLIAGSS